MLLYITASITGKGQALIELTNPADIAREDEVVAIPWRTIVSVYPGVDSTAFIVCDPISGAQLPYQLEYHGEASVQHLLIQVSIGAKAKVVLRVMQGKPAPFSSRTYCRYIPERDDDFAWENDRVIFRAYGQALEKKPAENAYGTDVWVKRTNRLVLNERYKRGDYHRDGVQLIYYRGAVWDKAGRVVSAEDRVTYLRKFEQRLRWPLEVSIHTSDKSKSW